MEKTKVVRWYTRDLIELKKRFRKKERENYADFFNRLMKGKS